MPIKRSQRIKLVHLLHQACVLRDKKCLWCGSVKTLQASHIYPKGRYPHMQWELDNVKTLCYSCHFFKWHRDTVSAYEWLKTAIKPSRLKRLKRLSLSTKKYVYDYDKIKKDLERKIKKYGSIN